jgi:hypothetical protein
VAAPAPPSSWLELSGKDDDAVLTRRDAGGGKTWDHKIGAVRAVIGAADGGAYAVVEEPRPSGGTPARVVVRIDARGGEAWRRVMENGGYVWRLFAHGDRVYAFDLKYHRPDATRRLHVIDAASGAIVRDVDMDPDVDDVDARGDAAVAAGAGKVSHVWPLGDGEWSLRVRMFPGLDPTAERHPDRKVAIGSDGTLLTGASDGSLLATDPDGKPLWQLGVRGAVAGIEARPGGDFVVRSHPSMGPGVYEPGISRWPGAGEDRGDEIATVVGPGGVVRREAATVERAPVEGGRVVDLRDGKAAGAQLPAGDPGPAPPWKPPPFVCWSTPEPDCELCTTCTDRRPAAFTCQRCAAPIGAGEGAVLAEEGWLRVHGGRASPEAMPIGPPASIAAAPSGALWAVSAGAGDGPHAVVETPLGLRLAPGLPSAAYADVAVRADDDVWMVGGLTTEDAGAGVAPCGEGTLVRFDGRTFTRHRAPDGALLSVAAAGPGEAWAVGLGGGVLHAKAGVVEAFHLEREGGGRLPVVLRSVAAAGPDDVWIAGDGPTLLHWDGKALRRVDTGTVGQSAALSAILAPGAKPGWVAGPGGLWRLVRAP